MQASSVNYDVPDNLFAPKSSSAFQPIPQQATSAQNDPSSATKFKQKCRSLNHPVATVFHFIWKVAALLVYMFANWIFPTSFVIAFISCVVLLAFDFWTVKNISGRLMVGLRWWNEIKDDGTNEWIFESLEDTSHVSGFEKTLFWGALFGAPTLWCLFAVISALKLNFNWLLIVCIALALSIANIIGYVKCARDARAKLKSFATSYITSAVLQESFKRATGV